MVTLHFTMLQKSNFYSHLTYSICVFITISCAVSITENTIFIVKSVVQPHDGLRVFIKIYSVDFLHSLCILPSPCQKG